MRFLPASILACAMTASGCGFLYLERIWYDLTASVVGVVERSNIQKVVGDGFSHVSTSTHFWDTYANEREQLLRVRLSTRKDLVLFANRKSVGINIQWHFCDKPEQAVHLGSNRVFVDAVRMPGIPRPSKSIADHEGQFTYDAILYIRDASPFAEGGRYGRVDTEIDEPYDLERSPRDVCVWVLLATKLRGFKTNVAKIPKEEIAAALGVEAGAEQPRQ